MKLQEVIRHAVLHVAKREGWAHPSVRVTLARRNNKATISISISGRSDMDVEGVLRKELDALRDLQSGEARRLWPEITVHSMVMLGATWTGTTVVRMDDGGGPTQDHDVRDLR